MLARRNYKRRIAKHLRTVAHILGLILVVACLNMLPPKRVLVGPPQYVITLNNKIGVHTRLTDEVEEWKIQRTLSMVREMGSPWIVEYFPWGYCEPRPGMYDWTHADMVVDHAQAQGLTILARVDFVPDWARPSETTFRHLDADHYGDYARFLAAFAGHYQGRIGHIIVWNEPNLSFEWGYRQPDPAAYSELLRQSYQAIKLVDPSIQVLCAGLAPTIAPPGDPWGTNDLLYLQAMYDAGAAPYFDAMAIHAYGLTFPPDEPADEELICFSRAELTREVMVRNGDEHKPCYITEGGWNDHPRWSKGVRPYQRMEYTIAAYEMAQRDWPWCEAVCLWAFRFPRRQQTYQDYFTFVTPEFVAKPIYVETAHYAHGEPYEFLQP